MSSRVLAAAAAALIVLGGCSSNGESPEETAAPTAPTTESGGKLVTEESGGQAVFGDTYVYSSGLEVTVGTPAEFTPTAEAAVGDKAQSYVQFEVTLANNSRRDLDMDTFYAELTSAGRPGDPVFDTGLGLDSYPEESLAKEESVSFLVGYGVADPTSMEMEVGPGSGLDPVVFRTD